MFGSPDDDGLARWARAWADAQRRRRRREWWEENRRGLFLILALGALYLAAGYIDELTGWQVPGW